MGAVKTKDPTDLMLVKRTISAILIFILGLFLILSGGWVYTAGITLILGCAAWEFINLFKNGGYDPNPYPILAGTIGITISSYLDKPLVTSLFYMITIFIILITNVLNYRHKESTAAFNVTFELAALLFITFLGTYLIKILILPNGLFWILISILPAGIGDVGAYGAGSLFGKHKLAPNLSPNKTIEGYIGGVFAALITSYVVGLIASYYVPVITISSAVLIGCVTGLLAPLGDLSKSIFKRQFNLKNTGDIIPGHGGVLDRIDTWLWAAPIAYFLIIFFFL